MEIRINTADILGDETTIRDEVVEQVSNSLFIELKTNAAPILARLVEETLAKIVQEELQKAIKISLDTEFTPIDSYGRAGKAATVRNRIAEFVQAECTLKVGAYDSKKNSFTRIIEGTVSDEMKKFKSEYISLVNKQLVEQSMQMAVETLRKALNLQK